MANAIKTAPGQRKKGVKREYRNPPVHEVILDVQFHRSLDEKALGEVRARLAESFPQVEQMNLVQLEVGVGTPYQNMVRQFGGWQFKRDGGWVVQAGLMALSVHLVRPGQWPIGPYVGWPAIYQEYLGVHAALLDVYGPLEPKRAGLRYLNRIAIPKGEDISRWMEFRLQAPQVLHDLYTFQLRQTWARAGDDEDISATLGVAKIDVGEPTIAALNQGVLLDIDVFNLWIEKAPKYKDLPDWFSRAHEVENEIFEGCMTNDLRARFDQ